MADQNGSFQFQRRGNRPDVTPILLGVARIFGCLSVPAQIESDDMIFARKVPGGSLPCKSILTCPVDKQAIPAGTAIVDDGKLASSST